MLVRIHAILETVRVSSRAGSGIQNTERAGCSHIQDVVATAIIFQVEKSALQLVIILVSCCFFKCTVFCTVHKMQSTVHLSLH